MVTDPDSTIYIFQDSEYNRVVNRLKNAGYACFCYKRKHSKNELINLFSYYIQDFKLRKYLKSLNFDKNKDRVLGSDHIYALFKFFRGCQNVTVIEEGLANYKKKEQLYKEFGIGSIKFFLFRIIMFQWNLLTYNPYGYDASVNNVWLTNLRDIPAELVNKTRVIDLEDLWKGCKQETINKVFGFDKDLYSNKSVILTQPLSEDGICNENRKIQIYNDLINQSEYPVIIKKHPRDTTNYCSCFKNIAVDIADYPFELLILNKANFKQVLTITSTVAYQCIGLCDVIISGTMDYSDLQRKLGVQEKKVFKKDTKV